jgi:Transposase IS4
MNNMHSFWQSDMFTGHSDFRSTMSQSDFFRNRANLQLRDPDQHTNDQVQADILWHSRKWLESFQKNSAAIAVPVGCSALDEASCRTKARTRAKSYIANKPDKYAIWFYAVVGHNYTHLSSMIDNHSGNTTMFSAPEAYVALHKDVQATYYKILKVCPDIEKKSATQLWICQVAHQTKLYPAPDKGIFY